ncbi:30S ribosomal protein S9 [Candidatus Dependentiae bacterium]|nr:30S ribosomal protein S9 [Candidatus Dependentiae bacterium]
MQKAQATHAVHGVGRRKSSVARVWVKQGSGQIEVNGKTHAAYFDTDIARDCVVNPLKLTGLDKKVDIQVNVIGGGMMGQAGAVSLAISRAIVENNDTLRGVLRDNGLLTVDARKKERKKYGQRGARRKFQFVKR